MTILDNKNFNNPLTQSEDESQDEFRKSALQKLLDKGHHPELHKSGIDIVIASSKRPSQPASTNLPGNSGASTSL